MEVRVASDVIINETILECFIKDLGYDETAALKAYLIERGAVIK